MNAPSPIVRKLRSRAAAGDSASVLAQCLQEYLTPDFSAFDFVRYFKEAFGIPLETLRDAEAWVGLNAAGTLDDHQFDQLLRPWLDPLMNSLSDREDLS